jgi:uncharacterized protein YdaU (DUF1376 family)
MSEHPWMPFYPQDFQLDTLDLDADQIGVYFTMIWLAWHRGDGGLPDDMPWLKKTLQRLFYGFHGHTFNRIVPKLLNRYFRLENGIWYQKRVVKELQKARKISANRRQNANKRWARRLDFNDLGDANAMHARARQSQSHLTLSSNSESVTPREEVADKKKNGNGLVTRELVSNLKRRGWTDGSDGT